MTKKPKRQSGEVEVLTSKPRHAGYSKNCVAMTLFTVDGGRGLPDDQLISSSRDGSKESPHRKMTIREQSGRRFGFERALCQTKLGGRCGTGMTRSPDGNMSPALRSPACLRNYQSTAIPGDNANLIWRRRRTTSYHHSLGDDDPAPVWVPLFVEWLTIALNPVACRNANWGCIRSGFESRKLKERKIERIISAENLRPA